MLREDYIRSGFPRQRRRVTRRVINDVTAVIPQRICNPVPGLGLQQRAHGGSHLRWEREQRTRSQVLVGAVVS